MSYEVVANHTVKTEDGREIKEGQPFPFDPDNLMHQQWMAQRRLRLVRLDEPKATAAPKKSIK